LFLPQLTGRHSDDEAIALELQGLEFADLLEGVEDAVVLAGVLRGFRACRSAAGAFTGG
jgi:hypothetical protein